MKFTILGIFASLALCAGVARAADSANETTETTVTTTKTTTKSTGKAAKKNGKAGKKENEASAKGTKKTLPDGLMIEDVKVGSGMEAKLGSKISVHYRGTLVKGGKEFDSSYKRNEPAEFMLENGQLIKGWTEGIPGMKVGGKRKLMVPYSLAYGERGTPDGSIPSKSDLNFEVELLKVE